MKGRVPPGRLDDRVLFAMAKHIVSAQYAFFL